MLLVPATLLVTWLGAWVGCAQPPVFNTITEVIVKTQTPRGVSTMVLEGTQLQSATRCLADTMEIKQEETDDQLLTKEVLLIQVKDRLGDRLFELYTDENMKNKGKYYRNKCIYELIKDFK